MNRKFFLFLLLVSVAFTAFKIPKSLKSTGGRFPKQTANDTIIGANGKPIVFKPFEVKWEGSENSKLNLSHTLDKPAGKNGFITIKDGHFSTSSGQRFRIWGVNLAFGASFPNKADAPKVAAYLTRFGINAVRLHFLDNGKEDGRYLFDHQADNTRSLSAEGLDKLDFFVSELKKAGVYININLNVGRTYRSGDGVPEYQALGFAKGSTLFNERLIELQKEYAKQLLTHVNPYTGNSYSQEPAVAMVEIVNENSLVEAWVGGRIDPSNKKRRASSWTNAPLFYINELNAKYTQWARKTLSKIEIKALEKEGRVTPGKNLSLLKPSEFGAASKLRFHTEAKFLVQTEGDFYTEMYDYLKRELGVKSLIAANSDCDHYYNGYALLSNLSKFDYIDGHAYWHIYDDSGKELYGRKDNIPMVTLPQMSNPVKLSRSAVQGKPYTVSEINNGNYNDYYSEGVPLTGAYSALQDWDGVFYFTLSHTSANNWNTFYPGGLDLVVDPIRMANMASSGLMYRRSDIQPSGSTVLRGYNQNDMIEGLRDTLSAMPFYTKNFNQLTPLIQKTRIASFTEQINDFPKIKDETKITSETGELTWHNKYNNSFVEVLTPNSEALIGFLPQSANLKHLQAKLKNDFGSITITSLDGKALHNAEKILLVTTARAGMKGMKWTEGKTKLLERGGRPTTIEVVSGEISLSGLAGAKSLIIEPLDGAGNPLRSITRTVENGKVIFPVGEDVTVWYYLTVKR